MLRTPALLVSSLMLASTLALAQQPQTSPNDESEPVYERIPRDQQPNQSDQQYPVQAPRSRQTYQNQSMPQDDEAPPPPPSSESVPPPLQAPPAPLSATDVAHPPQQQEAAPAQADQQAPPADQQQGPAQAQQSAPSDQQPASAQPEQLAPPSDQSGARAQAEQEPPSQEPPAAEPPQLAQRESRAHSPDQVPSGYEFLVTLDEPLDTATVARGKHFRALLREPLVAPNGRQISGGHWVAGHVSAVERGFRSMLLLSFDEIQTPRGWVPLSATVIAVPGEHGLKTPGAEGEIERKPIDIRRTLEGAGVGAVVGASAGEATGDTRTAALGAATGAATGAGISNLTDRNILLDRGAQLVLRLDRGVYLP